MWSAPPYLPALHVPAPPESPPPPSTPPPPDMISEVTKGSESLMIQQKESRFLLHTTLTILYFIVPPAVTSRERENERDREQPTKASRRPKQ